MPEREKFPFHFQTHLDKQLKEVSYGEIWFRLYLSTQGRHLLVFQRTKTRIGCASLSIVFYKGNWTRLSSSGEMAFNTSMLQWQDDHKLLHCALKSTFTCSSCMYLALYAGRELIDSIWFVFQKSITSAKNNGKEYHLVRFQLPCTSGSH